MRAVIGFDYLFVYFPIWVSLLSYLWPIWGVD